jgi:23S rRNA pseudouridine1911/1915/1917 synthase
MKKKNDPRVNPYVSGMKSGIAHTKSSIPDMRSRIPDMKSSNPDMNPDLSDEDISLEIPETHHDFTVQAAGERLDVYLVQLLPELSRSRIGQLVDENRVLVDGKPGKSGMKLKTGQHLAVSVPAPVPLEAVPQDIPLVIVHEDEDILVVDKPKGMVVHPAPGNPDGTLVNALLFHCGSRLSDINGIIRPGIVHRIDKDTSGLLVVAKNNKSHQSLSEALQVHGISRIYRAVVDGVVKTDEGVVDAPIGRHAKERKKMGINRRNGRHAVTRYRVLRRYRSHTLMEFVLETGRTHQIRVHMAYLGHPITGDTVYGTQCRLADTEGQALHARELQLVHPSTGETMIFESDEPEWMRKLVEILEQREQ